MLSDTATRVPDHTGAEANRRISDSTVQSVRWNARHPERLDERLRALDAEWDVDRVLGAKAAGMVLVGTALGIGVDRRFLALPLAASAFLLQHALQGWSPPLPMLRSLGFRTAREIDEERVALKALRGDFGPIGPGPTDRDDGASHAIQAARL